MRVLRWFAGAFLWISDVIMYPAMWLARPEGRKEVLRPSGGYYGDGKSLAERGRS